VLAVAAAVASTRVVLLRTGPVLSRSGGVLGKLKPLFGLALGGRIGSGRQFFPWISLDDQVGAIAFLVENQRMSGPVNLVGPNPVTNGEFTAALGQTLHRPTPFPVPGAALKLVLGADAAEELVLTGPRAVPAVLTAAGYTFRHPTVSDALLAAA
jgi:uncharacterized protein